MTYTDPSPLGAGTIGVTANAGITYFDNVSATVPASLGACCDPSAGTCTMTTDVGCPAPGIWHSDWSSCAPNPCPLPAPTLVAPADSAVCQATSGTLDWSDVSGADGYRYQIGTAPETGTEYDVTASQASYSELATGTTYYWRVKTKNLSETYGNYSGSFSFTTLPNPLAAPTLLSPADGATDQGTSGTLDWTDVTNATGYRYQIGTGCTTGTETDVTASQASYSGLAPNTTYWWRVKTKDSCNQWGDYSSCFSFAPSEAQAFFDDFNDCLTDGWSNHWVCANVGRNVFPLGHQQRAG